LAHRLELGIVAARGDERLALELAGGEARLELGEAVRDLRERASGMVMGAQPRHLEPSS
jgi:hypothetical protein